MKEDNQKTFMKAYQICHEEFLRYCSVVSYGRMEVQDLVQDVLFSAYKNFEEIRNRENLLHYLIKAARNRAITEKRKHSRQVTLSETYANKLLYGGISSENLVDVQIIYDSLKLLPEKQATSLLLFEVYGFKMKEIAAIIDSTEASVKMQVSRARKKMRSLLSEDKSGKKRYSILPVPINTGQSSSQGNLEDHWARIIKDIPPQLNLEDIEVIIQKFDHKSPVFHIWGNNILNRSAFLVKTILVLLIFLITIKNEKTTLVPRTDDIPNKTEKTIISLPSTNPEKNRSLPTVMLNIKPAKLNFPLVISTSESIPQTRTRRQNIKENQKNEDNLQLNFGQFTIKGDWRAKSGNSGGCIDFAFSESGENWKTRWKFKECFHEQNLERLLKNKKGFFVLERDAGQFILNKGKSRGNGVFKFRPNKSFQSYLLDHGFDPTRYLDKEISVQGSSKYTGKGKPVLTARPLEVIWFKFFIANIDKGYIDYLENHGYTAKEMDQLWYLADQEVTIRYLKKILPYKTITSRPLNLSDIAKLKMFNVNPSLIKILSKCKIESLSIEDIISMNQLEIPLDYIEKLCQSSTKLVSGSEIDLAYLTGASEDYIRDRTLINNNNKQFSSYPEVLKSKTPNPSKDTFRLSLNALIAGNNKEREVFPLSGFNKLVVSGDLKVGIAKYHNDQAIVFGDQNTRSKVRIKLKNNTLHISPKSRFISKNTCDVVVTGKNIQNLIVRGNAKTFSIGIEERSKDTLLSYVKTKMASENVVGYQALVIKNGKKVFGINGGVLKIGGQEEVNESTVFMIASLSKPIYALSLLKLVDKGLIDLDEPINSYISRPISNPYFPLVAITPRMLLAHTSSIQDNWDVLGPIYHPNSSIKEELSIKKFVEDYFEEEGKYFNKAKNFHQKPPGKVFDYSNTAYILIGHLIEEVTAQKMRDFCSKEIFDPLGMKDTFWYLQDIPHQNISSPHILENQNIISLPHYGYPSFPEGQIRTTVTDYAKFISVFLNDGKAVDKDYLSTRSLEEFLKVQYPSVNPNQLISWNLSEFGSEEFYKKVPYLPAHTGLEAGVTTASLFDVKTKSAVILFNNSQPSSFDGLLEIMTALCAKAGLTKK